MKSKQPALILALLAFAALALWAQTTQRTIPSTGGTSPSAVNANPQSRFIRILTPVASQKLATNIVRVSFEVTNPGVSGGMPNFLVQLDGNDPVRTTSTDYTFTGLAPGNHSVTIIMVDANETPIPGARSVVQFNILPPRSTSAPPAARPGGMAYNTDAPIVRMA
ncbi:MAG TPA: hypothetical protein VN622_13315, partial [Clostridia bacterium]|nr:hypothetical protein [Clostridia bacterium]